MIKVIRLNSDNYENALVTKEAYEEIRLQMSTGDFHTHKIETVLVEDFSDVITLMDLWSEYEIQ